jgi:hypothetical protein
VRVEIHSRYVPFVSSWPTLNTVDSTYSMEELLDPWTPTVV